MKKTSVLFASSLCLFSGITMAENFSYNQIQGTVHNTELRFSDGVDSFKDDDTGFTLSGTLRLPRSFYAAASYETVEIANVDLTNYSLGIGAFTSVAEGVDLFAELAYVNEEAKASGIKDDDSGVGITLGARGAWTPFFEAEARYRYADFGSGSDEMHTFLVSGMYKLTDQFGVGLNYRRDSVDEDDFKRTLIGAFVRATF